MRSLVTAMLVALTCGACKKSSPTPASTAQGAPVVQPMGRIDALLGSPVIVRGVDRPAVSVGMPLLPGDQIQTGPAVKVRAVFNDASVLAVGPETSMVLGHLALDKGRKGRLSVVAGKFWLQVAKWTGPGDSHFEVETPSAVAGVRGTTLWGDTKVDAICSLDGTVEVLSRKDNTLAPAILPAGNCAAQLSLGKLAPLSPTPTQVEGYLNEVLIK